MSGLRSTRSIDVARERREQHGADQRGAERRAEVLRGALQAAGLVGLRRLDRRHDHVAELREHQARRRRRTPPARPRSPPRRARRRSCRAAAPTRRRARAGRPARPASARDPAASFGPGHRGDEHRHRHREQPLARLERVEAEDHLEVDGQDEERAEQDELLHQQRGQPGAQRAGCAAAGGRAACRGPGARGAPPTARTRRAGRSRRAITNGTAEKPNGVISSPPMVSAPRGSISPHSLLLRMAKHDRGRGPAEESSTPTTSSRGRAAPAAGAGAQAARAAAGRR